MEDRLQRLAQQLPDDVDAMLICEAVNRQYFNGLRSDGGGRRGLSEPFSIRPIQRRPPQGFSGFEAGD